MIHCKALWLSVLVTALFAAAWKTNEPPAKDKSKKPSAPSTPPRDQVAAIVNGERIMLSELVGRLNELGVAPEVHEEVAGDLLDGLVENALLIQFLSAQKLPFDGKAVDKQIAEVKADYEKEGVKFSEALARIGMTEPKLRAALIAESQWQSYLKKNVTDKSLSEYFTKFREHFDGTQVRASHILIEVAPNADPKIKTAAKAKCEKIRKEIGGGLDFAEAARKYSDCPSKTQGGDVEWFPRREKMVEAFAHAAFSLKPGETSGVVETEFGYHLIKCTGRKPGTRTKLDDPELRKELSESFHEHLKSEIIAKQRRSAKIEIAPPAPPAK